MTEPRFTTKIELDGECGNIFVVWGRASRMLKQLDLEVDAEILGLQIKNAKSYEEALRFINHWFPLTRDGEDYRP